MVGGKRGHGWGGAGSSASLPPCIGLGEVLTWAALIAAGLAVHAVITAGVEALHSAYLALPALPGALGHGRLARGLGAQAVLGWMHPPRPGGGPPLPPPAPGRAKLVPGRMLLRLWGRAAWGSHLVPWRVPGQLGVPELQAAIEGSYGAQLGRRVLPHPQLQVIIHVHVPTGIEPQQPAAGAEACVVHVLQELGDGSEPVGGLGK